MIRHWDTEVSQLPELEAGANDRSVCASALRPSLLGIDCSECGATLYAARGTCVGCGGRLRGVRRALSGRGEIYSYTRVGSPGSAQEAILVMVRSEEGPLVTGRLLCFDAAGPRIGMPVELTGAELGLAFRPRCAFSQDGVGRE